MKRIALAMIWCWVAAFAAQAMAAIRLPHIIADHMVVQCGKEIPIWGWADAGEQVTVTLGDRRIKTSADTNGKWRVNLKPIASSDQPLQMTIAGASGPPRIVKDILAGEVWLGSGQSNMVMEVPADSRRDPPSSIRLFLAKKNHALEPLDDLEGTWAVASFDSLAPFSWVLFAFGRDLQEQLHLPIGLIQTTWGGTPIQAWIPADGFEGVPQLKDDLDLIKRSNAQYRQAMIEFRQRSATPDVGPPQHAFAKPGDWPGCPTVLYNAMIHPLAPYAIRGFLWYQGENNVLDTKAEDYSYKLRAMIGSWRRIWARDDLPFYYVQLPPFHYQTTNDPLKLTRLWQAQSDVLDMVGNTAMAPTMDAGDINDIHPGKKDIVAWRLAQIALSKTYGQSGIICSGPRYKSHEIDGSVVRVQFRDVGGGMISRDGKPLNWFQIAGEDLRFVDAAAEIEGDTVVVRSPEVPKPTDVRFGWANVAEPNLANKEGWPAIPFSTKRW